MKSFLIIGMGNFGHHLLHELSKYKCETMIADIDEEKDKVSDVVDDLGFIDATPMYGIEPDYSEGCAVFADTFYDIATSLVPIDTGYLESTIGAEGYDTWCEAYADAEYAQYVEYGT